MDNNQYFCILNTQEKMTMTDITEVKVINRSHHPLPQYATPLSAGMDLRANIDAPITLRPLERPSYPQASL